MKLENLGNRVTRGAKVARKEPWLLQASVPTLSSGKAVELDLLNSATNRLGRFLKASHLSQAPKGEAPAAGSFLAAGVPLPVVSARLSHSSVRTTKEIYAHMITGQDEEAARKCEEFQKRNRLAAGEGPHKEKMQ